MWGEERGRGKENEDEGEEGESELDIDDVDVDREGNAERKEENEDMDEGEGLGGTFPLAAPLPLDESNDEIEGIDNPPNDPNPRTNDVSHSGSSHFSACESGY